MCTCNINTKEKINESKAKDNDVAQSKHFLMETMCVTTSHGMI